MPVKTREPPPANSDRVALAAQADLSRLFDMVIGPALLQVAQPPAPDLSGFMQEAELSPEWPSGAWDSAGPFLSVLPPAGWLLDSVRQALLEECHRGFALMLGATFERQVRTWLASIDPANVAAAQEARLKPLWAMIQDATSVDVGKLPVASALEELWELVSAMRHGSGRAMRRLTVLAPHLWPRAGPFLPDRLPDPEITGADLQRYDWATKVFWGAVGATPPIGLGWDVSTV